METHSLKRKDLNFKELININNYNKAISSVIIFLLVNTLKISLFNYFLLEDATVSMFSYKFLLTLLVLMIFYPIILNFKSKYVFIAVYLLQTLYILVNLSYFLYFHSYLQIIQWISLFKEGFISTLHSSNPQNIKTFIAFIDLPFAIYLIIKYYRTEIERFNLRILKKSSIICGIILFTLIETINFIDGSSFLHFEENKNTIESKIVQDYGTLINSVVNIKNNITEENMIKQLKYGKDLPTSKASATKPNFVLIQVESLDANVINKKYTDEYVAPYLKTLTEHAIYYPYVLSYHKGGGTSDSEFSILNSIEPLDSFPAIKLPNYEFPNSVVSRLSDNGYNTIAFHGNTGTFYNRDTALPKMGFQEFYDINKMEKENVGWGVPDHEVFDYALDKFNEIEGPFFSYIITMTSHGPFTNASNYYVNDNFENIEDEATKNYFNSISYVDESLKNFVTAIHEKYENTYIFIYGDHTPNVISEDFNQAAFTMDNRYFEFVPLLIITPDNKQFMENTNTASFLDISPTIINTSGINTTIRTNGQDLILPNNLKNKIPFRDELYNRNFIFNKALETYILND